MLLFKYSCTKNFTAIPTRRGSKIERRYSCNQNHTFAFLTHKKFTASFMPYRMKDLFCHPSEIIPRQICLDVYWCHQMCIHLCVRKREWNIPYLRNGWHCIIPIRCSFNSIWGKDGNPKNILRPKKGIEDIILILLLR